MSNGTLHTGRRHIHGKGMGSVLLNKGGAGSGSSYSSLDEYIATTHENPFSGGSIGKKSLASMNKKNRRTVSQEKRKEYPFQHLIFF
jgi:hypothetical protein